MKICGKGILKHFESWNIDVHQARVSWMKNRMDEDMRMIRWMTVPLWPSLPLQGSSVWLQASTSQALATNPFIFILFAYVFAWNRVPELSQNGWRQMAQREYDRTMGSEGLGRINTKKKLVDLLRTQAHTQKRKKKKQKKKTVNKGGHPQTAAEPEL